MSESNVSLRFSLQQFLSLVAVLAALLGAWADMRTRLALLTQATSLRAEQEHAEHDLLWAAVREIRAKVP